MRLWCLDVSPDGKYVAAGGDYQDSDRATPIFIWHTHSGKEITRLEGHTRWVKAITFSPDGNTAASGSHDRTTRLWNMKTGKELCALKGIDFGAEHLAFSPDGKILAVVHQYQGLHFIDVRSGKEIMKRREGAR